jgi:cardiolipin synthase
VYVALHQTTGRPDWEAIKPNHWNIWQQLAARTKGVFTPANVISLSGVILVIIGLVYIVNGDLVTGFWLIVVGRVCDLIDGAVAHRTGTKSPLGEAVDASCDKIGALGVLIIFATEHVVPWWVIVFVGAQNVANVVIGYLGRQRKLSIHPVLSGKLSTASLWASFFSFILARAYSGSWLWVAYSTLVPAVILGVVATLRYARQLSGKQG